MHGVTPNIISVQYVFRIQALSKKSNKLGPGTANMWCRGNEKDYWLTFPQQPFEELRIWRISGLALDRRHICLLIDFAYCQLRGTKFYLSVLSIYCLVHLPLSWWYLHFTSACHHTTTIKLLKQRHLRSLSLLVKPSNLCNQIYKLLKVRFILLFLI